MKRVARLPCMRIEEMIFMFQDTMNRVARLPSFVNLGYDIRVPLLGYGQDVFRIPLGHHGSARC